MFRRIDLIALSIAFLTGCFLSAFPIAAEPAPGSTSAAIRDRLQGSAPAKAALLDREALNAFYSARDYRLVWVDETGPTRAATKALAEFANAGAWGLDSVAYRTEAVARPMASGRWTVDETAAAELQIASAMLAYVRDARGGRITQPDRQLTTYLDRAPRLPDPIAVLTDAATAADPGAYLRASHPRHAQFHALKGVLAELLEEQKGQVDLKIAAKGPVLLPGKTYPDAQTLRRRFGVAAAEVGAEQLYDAPLVAAVKKFQAAMALKPDGVVGPATRKALNVNADDKIAAVISNMEQWRWMPDDLGATHIFVNVPSFSIDFVQNGATTFSERVIVGKAETQTPIFSHEMTTIVMRPDWYLPDSIKLKKLLSGRRLESQGLLVSKAGRVVDSGSVDWGKANLSAYAVYQKSGDDNALGAVKFLFPNKHSVYLHDTPDKALFNDSARNFSHGCIRVRNPLKLAQLIFDADAGRGTIDAAKLARRGPHANEITLRTPIPVHIAHFTVWVGADGKAQYMADRYGHQNRITLALNGRWGEIDRGKDHLAAIDVAELQALKRLSRSLASSLTDPAGLTGSPFRYYRSASPVENAIRRALGDW